MIASNSNATTSMKRSWISRNFRRVAYAVAGFLLVRWLFGGRGGLSMQGPSSDLEILPVDATNMPPFQATSCVYVNQKCIPEAEAEIHIPKRGLYTYKESFYMDGRPFRILSGSFHYFRTQPAQWGDRLLKMKAAGLNTVMTYIPWNLHERNRGEINFNGRSDLHAFMRQVQEVGLYLIIRPGPYICAEWDWGGLPSWLLHDPNMVVRTSQYKPYLEHVEAYFANLIPVLVPFQKKRGGPIIAFQIENEYGSYGSDKAYLEWLKGIFTKYGLEEMFFTSDGPKQLPDGTLPDVLATVYNINQS